MEGKEETNNKAKESTSSYYSNEEIDYSDNELPPKNKTKVLINESDSDTSEYEYDYEEGEDIIEKKIKELKNKIIKVEKQDNINIIYIDENLNKIHEDELIKLINKKYDIYSEEDKGGQAVVKNIGNNLVARISDDFVFNEKKHIKKNEVIEYMQKYKQEEYNKIKNISNDELLEYIKENYEQIYSEMYDNISNDEIIKYMEKNDFIEYKKVKEKVQQIQTELENLTKTNVQNDILKNIPENILEEYKINYMKEKYSEKLKKYKETLFIEKLENYIFSSKNLEDYKTYVIKEKSLEYIENNNEILSRLKGIKTGSTIPINSFVFVNRDGYKIIGISKLKEKGNLKNAKMDEKQKNLSSISRIEQLIKIFKNEHIAGIIHRDIKSVNILVDNNDKLTATDYGIVNIIGKEISEYCGTPAYIAPEIFKDELKTEDITQKIDIYSLGIMFFEELLKYDNIYKFTKEKYAQFCDNEEDENKKKPRYFFSEYSKKIVEDIKKDDIYLYNFLPKEIIDDNNNISKIDELKEKLIALLKHMLVANPQERATIFEVEKEFEEIVAFILENFKKIGEDNIEVALTREDLLFLDKSKLQQQIQNPEKLQKQEEIKNKKLYDLKEFNENTIKTASDKFKKSLKKLLETEENKELYKDGVLFDRDNEGTAEQLDSALNSLELKKILSEKAKKCLITLKNCIIEDYNIKLPDESFYEEINDLKNNTEEYLTVINKLIQLRELKLAIEIQKLEQIESDLKEENPELKEEIKKLREFRDDVKLATRVYENEEIAKSLFVKNKNSEDFKNLFEKFQKKELELRNVNEKLINIYINIICSGQKGHSELIRILYNKIDLDKQDIIINKLFNKAIENKSINVILTLIRRKVVSLDCNKINDCIKVICSEGNYLELTNIIIDKIKSDSELFSSFINNIFHKIENNNNIINNLLINNINNIITIFNSQQNPEISLFVPFEIICIDKDNKYSELIENFINNIISSNNCINIFNIAYSNNYVNIIDKLFENENSKKIIFDNIVSDKKTRHTVINNIFNLAYNNDCPNIIDTLFKNNKLKGDIVELLYKSISDGKTKIVKGLINLGIKFNRKKLEDLAKKDDKLFISFKKNLAKMANINYQNIENIKIMEKKDIFKNKKYYLNENNFAELENALNSIVSQNTNEMNIQ